MNSGRIIIKRRNSKKTSPNLSILRQALERGTKHSPRFSELLMNISNSEMLSGDIKTNGRYEVWLCNAAPLLLPSLRAKRSKGEEEGK